MHPRFRSDGKGDHAGQCQQADKQYVRAPRDLRPMARPGCVRHGGCRDNAAPLVSALVSALRPGEIAALHEQGAQEESPGGITALVSSPVGGLGADQIAALLEQHPEIRCTRRIA